MLPSAPATVDDVTRIRCSAAAGADVEGLVDANADGDADTARRLDRVRMLVVDDDDDVREMLSNTFVDLGASVYTARNGQRAIDVIESGLVPDVIVLDLMMPGIDGWGVWDWLQSTPARSRIPVVVLTATGLSQGAVGKACVVRKGCTLDDLVAKIRHTMHDWR